MFVLTGCMSQGKFIFCYETRCSSHPPAPRVRSTAPSPIFAPDRPGSFASPRPVPLFVNRLAEPNRSQAFGLVIHSNFPIPGLENAAVVAVSTVPLHVRLAAE